MLLDCVAIVAAFLISSVLSSGVGVFVGWQLELMALIVYLGFALAGDKLFWQVDQRYWLLHALKPGIVGLAQVRGFRGATDREEDVEHCLAADLEYLRDWSIWREISILASTVSVITHKNAF